MCFRLDDWYEIDPEDKARIAELNRCELPFPDWAQALMTKYRSRTNDLSNRSSQPAGAAVMTNSQHVYEVRPRKDKRGVDLISDALPFGRLWYAGPNAVANVIGYATRDPASSLSQSVLSRTNPASYRAQSAL
jgi:hypothetical protein